MKRIDRLKVMASLYDAIDVLSYQERIILIKMMLNEPLLAPIVIGLAKGNKNAHKSAFVSMHYKKPIMKPTDNCCDIPHASIMKQLRAGAQTAFGDCKPMIQSKCTQEVIPCVNAYIDGLCERLIRIMQFSGKTTVTTEALALLGVTACPSIKCVISKEACFRLVKDRLGTEYRFTSSAKCSIMNAVCYLVDALAQKAAAIAISAARKTITAADVKAATGLTPCAPVSA